MFSSLIHASVETSVHNLSLWNNTGPQIQIFNQSPTAHAVWNVPA